MVVAFPVHVEGTVAPAPPRRRPRLFVRHGAPQAGSSGLRDQRGDPSMGSTAAMHRSTSNARVRRFRNQANETNTRTVNR